jgi:hypothetical protein
MQQTGTPRCLALATHSPILPHTHTHTHRCGDLYGDAAVDTFNACAVSEQKVRAGVAAVSTACATLADEHHTLCTNLSPSLCRSLCHFLRHPQQCVPQRADEGLYPVPCPDALDTSFDLNAFSGRWFITAGLNPLFDAFDCQVCLFVRGGVSVPGGGSPPSAWAHVTSLTPQSSHT